MAKKIILGGLLAGVLMFVWSSLAHTVLPIGEMGISTTANEDAVLAVLKANLSAPGFYFIPGHLMMQAEKSSGADREKAMAEWQSKYGGGPWAVMMYHPSGANAMATRQLVCELLADVFAGFILAFALLMSLARIRTFWGRVVFVTVLGLLPWLIVDASYLNWYGFPFKYGMGQLVDQGIGAMLAGVGLAALFRKE
ncbi:MAG TPA: hypothetical protein VJ124_22415 [Pyrinomonadaceae bacterium]|nr:hypothetical protein [Pyrinomonadaceae bacterium]